MVARHVIPQGVVTTTVVVASLGYAVDLFDIALVGALRVPTLRDLGIAEENLMQAGLVVTNAQMLGLILGAFFWGTLADRKGRMYGLFGSIILYSLASLANAFVTHIDQHILLRFVGGFGLAGELGPAASLIVEALPKDKRGYGTSVFAMAGMLGILLATVCAHLLDWRICYLLGGLMGLALLVLRIKMFESGMFLKVAGSTALRGRLWQLAYPWPRAKVVVGLAMLGLPVLFCYWYFAVFALEIGKGLGLADSLNPAVAMGMLTTGAAVGDVASGMVSQYLRSRKKTVLMYLGIMLVGVVTLLNLPPASSAAMAYGVFALVGLGTGYWATFVTMAAEQVGTNLRATVASTAPSLVRVLLVGVTSLAGGLSAGMGVLPATWLVFALVVASGLLGLALVHETFGKNLDYIEE